MYMQLLPYSKYFRETSDDKVFCLCIKSNGDGPIGYIVTVTLPATTITSRQPYRAEIFD
jgi:hypothetical protein